MTNCIDNALAINEFAFRYLFPESARKQQWPLDLWEQEQQVRFLPAIEQRDLSDLFKRCITGSQPKSDLLQRVLASLFHTHFPFTLTPKSPYGFHAAYPSPRSYYPLSFVIHLVDDQYSRTFQLDLVNWKLLVLEERVVTQHDLNNTCHVVIKTDFTKYNELYNLFRKSLYALEIGHFIGSFSEIAATHGLNVSFNNKSNEISCEITDTDQSVQLRPLSSLISQFRFRNSGRFNYGLFPSQVHISREFVSNLSQVISAALLSAKTVFCPALVDKISLKACFAKTSDYEAGLYEHHQNQFIKTQAGNYIAVCEDNFNYHNFSFKFIPIILFICVEKYAFNANQSELIALNSALGFISQKIINHLTGQNLFGRPFRSYDQFSIDHMLSNKEQNKTAYYGLLIGKNRGSETLGVLR